MSLMFLLALTSQYIVLASLLSNKANLTMIRPHQYCSSTMGIPRSFILDPTRFTLISVIKVFFMVIKTLQQQLAKHYNVPR